MSNIKIFHGMIGLLLVLAATAFTAIVVVLSENSKWPIYQTIYGPRYPVFDEKYNVLYVLIPVLWVEAISELTQALSSDMMEVSYSALSATTAGADFQASCIGATRFLFSMGSQGAIGWALATTAGVASMDALIVLTLLYGPIHHINAAYLYLNGKNEANRSSGGIIVAWVYWLLIFCLFWFVLWMNWIFAEKYADPPIVILVSLVVAMAGNVLSAFVFNGSVGEQLGNDVQAMCLSTLNAIVLLTICYALWAGGRRDIDG